MGRALAKEPPPDQQVEQRHVSCEHLANRVADLTLRLAAESSGRGLDTKTVMVRETHQDSAVAHRRLKLALWLGTHQTTRTAMATGALSEAQAGVILDAVTTLGKLLAERDDLESDVPARAETALVELAAEHTPKELAVCGRRILDVVAPDVADQVLADQLQHEQDHAHRDTTLTLCDDGHGRTRLRGTIPSSVATMLRRNLRALMAPKHVRASSANSDASDASGSEKNQVLLGPGPERWGRAFTEWIERYPIDKLPKSGGVQARAIVTIDHHQLTNALTASGIATIDGTLIPASEARRLACEAGILPLVLNGTSRPLDLGRTRRLHDTGQRLVLDIRDKTCTTQGCDWPAALCHAHHDTPWSQGGSTTVDTGRLLCPHHHQLAHHPR